MIRRLGLIHCRQANWLLSQRRDAPLPWLGRCQLHLHLAVCKACRRADQQFDLLSRAMRRLGS